VQGSAQLADTRRQRGIAHRRLRPYRRKEVLSGHQLLRPCQQVPQDLNGFAGEPHDAFATPKPFIVRV
jgi:hypothetical protein